MSNFTEKKPIIRNVNYNSPKLTPYLRPRFRWILNAPNVHNHLR